VNAGGNTVSVFSLDRSNGNLTLKNNVPSGGTRPVGIAFTKKGSSDSDYWVVVANQWNNPNVQKDGAMIERYPNNAFHQMNLKAADATDDQRNIQLFSFNASTGALTSERQLDNYVRENGGPTTVCFSDDGSKLAVTTWGIAHFSTMNPSLSEQKPSRVYVYNFANGNVSGERFFEEEGIAGTIGFNWAKGNNTRLFVSNFNLTTAKINNSVTVLSDNGTNVTKSAGLGVTSMSAINEACWTVLNPAGNKLYVASFATNLVSTFNVTVSGLSFSSSEARSGTAPMGDSKDVYVTPDNKYLYNLGSFKSYSINGFTIDGNTIDYKTQTFLATTKSGAGVAGKYNFLGLTGFDIR
jgi:6-phosphogluconolactonase (cycloisomerase 2 family)